MAPFSPRARGATLTGVTTCLGVELTQDVRHPVTDPTLGIPVPHRDRPPNWAHRLVTVGDSLTHGFQHFAIFNTAESWPAMIADQLGIQLAYPTYPGPGGHPLNIEYVARRFQGNLLLELLEVYEYMRHVRNVYTTPPGSNFPDPEGTCNENLAIWGWDLRDTLVRTADTEMALIQPPSASLLPLVNDSGHRAAVSVLNAARKPSGVALTPLDAARQLGDADGGIETLCVWLGANNVLGSIVDLKAVLSGPDYQDLTAKSNYTVWTNADYTAELTLVADEIRGITADHVLWATVPHVTIPPISHGLNGPLADCNRYFNYYGRVWESDATFDPTLDPHLTGYQAWAIDIIIDGYNTALQTLVAQARHNGLDWQIVDLCAVLDRLAYRRNIELNARPDEFPEYPLPPEYNGLDTRYFTTDNTGNILTGGLIGLDGVHPTTCGYGLVAQEFINVMTDAGVEFAHGTQLNFEAIRQADTLVSTPPPRINDTLTLIRRLDHDLDLLKRLDPFR
jgi:hypothetical protein